MHRTISTESPHRVAERTQRMWAELRHRKEEGDDWLTDSAAKGVKRDDLIEALSDPAVPMVREFFHSVLDKHKSTPATNMSASPRERNLSGT